MRIRLYLDEDAMDDDLIEALRARSVDLTTVREAQMLGRSDEDQLLYATEQGRVVYTFNVGDYLRLYSKFLEQGQSHGGMILGEQRRWSVGEQMRRLLNVIDAKSAEDIQGQFTFLSAWG
jgi:hypothetical protein